MTKKFLPLLALVFILGNCKNDTGGNATEIPVKIPDNLGGYWVNTDWWQELQSTKSPKKAAEKAGEVTAAIFRQDSTKWLADVSYNWHEGQQLTLRTKDGGLQLYDPQNAAVRPYQLMPLPDGTIRLDSVTMVRLGDAFTGFNVISHTLVGGQYGLGDKTVVFNPNGTVVGLDDYYRYELLLDYVADEVGADQLMLSKEGQTPIFYALKMEGNHLQLFSLKDVGSADEFKYEVGKLKYDLVKK